MKDDNEYRGLGGLDLVGAWIVVSIVLGVLIMVSVIPSLSSADRFGLSVYTNALEGRV